MDKVVEPVAGDILGQNYLIEGELGRGGFGVVFKARHIDIERVVAIKVLLATYAKKDPSAKERFRREATIAASLNYPNSLRVFDYGETDDGVFYLVMEYLKGQELARLLQREGRLPLVRAFHIVRQILYALSEAHMRGIVHRDIKPENVMLIELAYDPEHVKVMDFGIAKMVDAGEQITRAGITLGTPRYMPVEQLKGERLTPATDLYAVGLVLYEMLVGAPAFDAPTAVDMALQVMRGPSIKVPEDAGVPEVLVQVIEKASAREVEDRYQTAGELLDALDIAATALGILSVDHYQLPPGRAAEIGAMKRSAGVTVSLPEFDRDAIPEGGDVEDILKTRMLESGTGRVVESASGLTQSQRAAATQSLDIDAVKAAAQAAETQAITSTTPVHTTTFVHDEAAARADDSGGVSRTGAGELWFGAPPILVVLHVAGLMLLIILLALGA